ncbi:MAG: AraC family transcriptional regulator [Gordonia sp. (in: high G+C Gram-positive bacteria)]|uniref:helix-turn-helix domain-containing protein n=1 Tax=Gordonia sp. (in: high G+C Gram-positive bacteria) TaxID=84139 RepID=UPI0039E6E241
MAIDFTGRASDSSFIERVWTSSSAEQAPFLSIANGRCEIVVSEVAGQRTAGLRGPETSPTWVECPVGRWFGIRLAPGVRFRNLPVAALMNLADSPLPVAADGAICFGGTWTRELTMENAETMVSRLARQGFLIGDDIAGAAGAARRDADLSRRTVERTFRRVTGLSRGQFRQVDRARAATILLRDGASIADVVDETGYYDQAHLTKSLQRFIGLTPSSIRNGNHQLSLLYKTAD